jgi:hypothetical protein
MSPDETPKGTLRVPDLDRRCARTRGYSIVQRYVLIAGDGAVISNHRDLRVATEHLLEEPEPGGYIWDRFRKTVAAPLTYVPEPPARTIWERLRDEDD